MNIREIKALIKLMQGTDVRELELVRDKNKVRITRDVASPPVSDSRRAMAVETEQDKQKNYKTVTSPMVGTFYLATSPDASPFVEEGSVIKKGQIICIVEAMKLMNDIEAEFDGRIVSILVGNAQPVEFGEPLFLIEPL
ncbi:MAG: acetyl-CoA carboxylase biotin carboxyl carrier protein [Thermodesulfobacteriota bacterium]